jgi:predicted RNA-binding protein with RPS1 domain
MTDENLTPASDETQDEAQAGAEASETPDAEAAAEPAAEAAGSPALAEAETGESVADDAAASTSDEAAAAEGASPPSEEATADVADEPVETVPEAPAQEEAAPAPIAAFEETAPEPVTAVEEPAPVPEPAPAPAAVEAPAPAPVPEPPAPFDEQAAGMEQDHYSRTFTSLNEGDVIQGVVVHIDREGVLVDVGTKSEGIIRRNELSRDTSIPAEDIVQVGQTIDVYVMEAENQDGNLILSKKRADFEKAWEKVQEAKEDNRTIQAMVTDRVKGGLVVDLGIRGFVPASHVGNGSMKNNLERYVGQSIPLKVIEVDKERRKVVLSNKLAQAPASCWPAPLPGPARSWRPSAACRSGRSAAAW